MTQKEIYQELLKQAISYQECPGGMTPALFMDKCQLSDVDVPKTNWISIIAKLQLLIAKEQS